MAVRETDLNRIRKIVESLAGSQDGFDLSKVPITDLIQVKKIEETEEPVLANIESSFLKSGQKPSGTDIEMLARQSRAQGQRLADFFSRPTADSYETPPLPLVAPKNIPEIQTNFIPGWTGSAKQQPVLTSEYLQGTVPELVKEATTQLPKRFEEYSEEDLETVKSYIKNVGSKSKNEKDYLFKMGELAPFAEDFVNFYKNKKSQANQTKNAPAENQYNQDQLQLIKEAQDAIDQGADQNLVLQRLEEMGIKIK